MLYTTTDDLRIQSLSPLISPAILMQELPLNKQVADLVTRARTSAESIVKGGENRLMVIVGPCSIHDPEAAKAYAALLREAVSRYENELLILMRVYFEKPRTTVGWKGLINDPLLDSSFNINLGLKTARKLLLDINEMGVPTATEFLDTVIPQFISDLVSWGVIGARTTESQVHRELASGLSMPVGFKNGTDGNTQIAIDAVSSAKHPHHFLSVTKHGTSAIFKTTGNDACHVVLRGARSNTNYDAASVADTATRLQKAKLNKRIMIDCSHGNSAKDYRRQIKVVDDVAAQIRGGSQSICGVMLESNLVAGQQALKKSVPLVYGKSITDACIAWDETEIILQTLADAVQMARQLTWSAT